MSTQENPRKENRDYRDCNLVTLVLRKDKRWKVDKQTLICKSAYFAALLSLNFNDYQQREHIIHYDIPTTIIQEFVTWINESKADLETDRLVKYSSGKYTLHNVKNLLKLLHLSILFTVDQLREDIINVIEKFWLNPQYVILIWLVAQELSLHILEDISLAACTDHFENLPVEQLINLSYDEFKKLVGNVNVRSRKNYLQNIISKWSKHNNRALSINMEQKKEPKFLHYYISSEDHADNNSKIHVFCWDGSKFYEQSQFKYPEEINNISLLTGMQCTGRGYNIYLCGGEYGLGTGRFNRKLWRYSLISKKWYYMSLLPTPRRHMVFVPIKNKLLLVAGVGQFRLPSSKVDIYDLHTQTWSRGVGFRQNFVSMPDYCVSKDKLIIYTQLISTTQQFHIYLSDDDIWHIIIIHNYYLNYLNVVNYASVVPYRIDTCYLVRHQDEPDKLVLVTTKNDILPSECNQMEDCNQQCKNVELNVIKMDYSQGEKLFAGQLNGGYILIVMDCNFPMVDSVPISLHTHSVHMNTQLFYFKSNSFSFKYSIKKFSRMIDLANLHTEWDIFKCDEADCNNARDCNNDCNSQSSEPSMNNYSLGKRTNRPWNEHSSSDSPSTSSSSLSVTSPHPSNSSLTHLPLIVPEVIPEKISKHS